MIRDHLLLGQGYGVFAYEFPQTDFVGKQLNWGISNVIVEKPHNLFLQIALGGGVWSLVLFLVLVGGILRRWHLVERSGVAGAAWGDAWVLGSDLGELVIVGGLGSGIIGYIIAGCVNDSTIFVGPLFWVFGGIVCRAEPRFRKKVEPAQATS